MAACIEDETCHAGLMTTNTCMTCGRYADRTGNIYQYGVRKYGGITTMTSSRWCAQVGTMTGDDDGDFNIFPLLPADDDDNGADDDEYMYDMV